MKYNKCSKHKEEGILDDDKQCKESVESLNFELLNIDTNDKNEVFDEEKDVGTDTASINFTRVWVSHISANNLEQHIDHEGLEEGWQFIYF